MTGPHQDRPVRMAGAPLESARALVLLVHGRGASAESMLALAAELDRPEVAFAAPQASGFTWYPQSFLAPIDSNEPGLSSGLDALGEVLEAASRAGVPAERQILLGFSQGACLASEYAARSPRRYGGVAALTGGLVGPEVERERYRGSMACTPVLLASSDPDPHVPWPRVEESAAVFEALGARVDLRRYPGMAHTVNREEIELVRAMMDRVLSEVEDGTATGAVGV